MFNVKQWCARLIKWGKMSGAASTKGRVILQTDAEKIDGEEGERPQAGTARQIQQFGFRSVPVAGSEIVVLAVRGAVQQSVVVASDNPQYGPAALQEGECEIYNKVTGTKILLDKDGNVTISTDTGNVTVVPGAGKKVQLGDSTAGNLDSVALFTQLQTDFDALVSKFNGHTHPVNGVFAGAATVTTATTVTPAGPLSASVASSNVVAKK